MSYLKSTPSNLSNCKIWRKNEKDQNLWPKIFYWVFLTKNAFFGYFRARIKKKQKNYCHIWNQHPPICIFTKFCKETNMPKFGSKNALFGYFWARILKNSFDIETSTLKFIKKRVHKSYSDFWYRVCFL